MANRGNVKYTEVSDIAVDSELKSDPIKLMCTAIKYNLQEAIGYNNIKNNPKDWPNKKYRTVASGKETELDNLANSMKTEVNMSAATINSILTHADTMLGNIGQTKIGTRVSAEGNISVALLNKAAASLRAASTFFNGKNSWWDSSNYCALSCQVACQEACQLACQSCQYNTCHAQNCGGWS